MNITEYFAGQNDGGGQFECEHGPTECAGNLLELCAYNLTVKSSPYGWWTFGVCMQDDYNNIPDNAQSCATKAGLNYNQILKCSTGPLGAELFAASINFLNAEGIDATPTVIINGVVYVGGPDDPLSTVCNVYIGIFPDGCSDRKKISI
jgi:hypothetical protein